MEQRIAADLSGDRFSALQRAENSSNPISRERNRLCSGVSVLFSEPKIPQKPRQMPDATGRGQRFSALQRAENSSNRAPAADAVSARWVSVLFSEPKIPQSVSSIQRCVMS